MKKGHSRNSDPQDGGSKKRKLPEPSDVALLPREVTLLGVLPSTENEDFVGAKSVKRSKSDDGGQTTMVGRPVDGVVDGVFEAGYLVSVRIAGSDAVFRGAVFRPGMIIPPWKTNNRSVDNSYVVS